MAEEDTCGI